MALNGLASLFGIGYVSITDFFPFLRPGLPPGLFYFWLSTHRSCRLGCGLFALAFKKLVNITLPKQSPPGGCYDAGQLPLNRIERDSPFRLFNSASNSAGRHNGVHVGFSFRHTATPTAQGYS